MSEVDRLERIVMALIDLIERITQNGDVGGIDAVVSGFDVGGEGDDE